MSRLTGFTEIEVSKRLKRAMQQRGAGENLSSRISIEIEISTKDINGLFKGLENARMSGVAF